LKGSSLTLASSATAAVTLHKHQKSAREWRDHDLIRKLVPGALPLEIASGKFNGKSLSIARNFVNIARACTRSSAVYYILVNQPDGERYNHLKDQHAELEQQLTEERKNWERFCALGAVNENEW